MARMVNLYNHPDVQKIDRHYTLDTLPPDTPQSPSSGRVKMSGSFEKSVKGATKIKVRTLPNPTTPAVLRGQSFDSDKGL